MKMLDRLRRQDGRSAPARKRNGGDAELAAGFAETIEKQIAELWRAFEHGPWANLSAKLSVWPAIDETEDEQGITLRADVPGLGPQDVDVEVAGNLLTIRGKREEESEEKGAGFRRHERRIGSFCRTVTLPPYLDPDKIEAAYDKGILTIRVPRIPGEGPKRVVVKTS